MERWVRQDELVHGRGCAWTVPTLNCNPLPGNPELPFTSTPADKS